ncbi:MULTISPECIES: septum formation initiator family protein [unclassified Candidatus Cardinium]|uniref:FtsB family cell division protein n=1 Tax=unclassified Candidatus Cardinium TaxID=2641185 RepID=UPI001FB1D05D|nr:MULTISPECIES: septum formation initiator family protein [unclassified Candidatus Cardinium]
MKYLNSIQSIKKVLLDPYAISTVFFAVWMLCFDDQNLGVQASLYNRLKKLKTDRVEYISQIQQIKKDKKELVGNLDFLEKMAREKYYMKREKEDLYVIMRE